MPGRRTVADAKRGDPPQLESAWRELGRVLGEIAAQLASDSSGKKGEPTGATVGLRASDDVLGKESSS